jgi:predicted metal-dependent phosphoesterase TrpH
MHLKNTCLPNPANAQRDDLIESMVDSGLEGIETYCNGLDKATLIKYRELAKKYSLICCGGSDFHNDRSGAKFGLGSVRVPYSVLESLRKSVQGNVNR